MPIFTLLWIGNGNIHKGLLTFIQCLSPLSLLGKFPIVCLGGKYSLSPTIKLKMPGAHYLNPVSHGTGTQLSPLDTPTQDCGSEMSDRKWI